MRMLSLESVLASTWHECGGDSEVILESTVVQELLDLMSGEGGEASSISVHTESDWAIPKTVDVDRKTFSICVRWDGDDRVGWEE